MKVHFNF